MSSDLIGNVYSEMRQQVRDLKSEQQRIAGDSERAETAGGFSAMTLAAANAMATAGGMSDGATHIDAVWISNGVRPGESAGAGTGVLAVWAGGAWRRVGDYAAVQA
ncbi:MAG: hypothetical protein SF123_09620 [Chloroflexota bacterium]|nr:hypothetical protein [Chloroflexota bacterium]